MINAKKEFVEHVGNRCVLCADIFYRERDKEYVLPVGYTEAEYHVFLFNLSFMYDEGYGVQEVEGWIWYEDGTWSDRHEYDGSERWVYRSAPPIPAYLTGGKVV